MSLGGGWLLLLLHLEEDFCTAAQERGGNTSANVNKRQSFFLAQLRKALCKFEGFKMAEADASHWTKVIKLIAVSESDAGKNVSVLNISAELCMQCACAVYVQCACSVHAVCMVLVCTAHNAYFAACNAQHI